eukprot:scpid39477/ scgid4871/ AP-5 complex subunit zeta-1; Adapter-related protein complex 5 zeta subunit
MAIPYVRHSSVSSRVSVEDALFNQARALSDGELQEFCENLITQMKGHDRSNDFITMLRKFYVLVQATRKNLPIPRQLIDQLYMVLSEPEQGAARVRLLCAVILREIAPTALLEIRHFNPPVETRQLPFILPVVLAQGARLGFLSQITPILVKLLAHSGADQETCQRILSSLAVIACRHTVCLTEEHIAQINNQLIVWLRNASTVSAPNPYAGRQLFSSNKQPAPVKEIDGSASRDFFTVLSVGQYYSSDQWLNIQSFSMLRTWMLRTFPPGSFVLGSSRIGTVPASPFLSATTSRTPSPGDSGAGHSSSVSDLSSMASHRGSTTTIGGSTTTDLFSRSRSKLREKAYDYCMRLVDQCDKKPEKKSDEDLVHSALLEVTFLLDRLCTNSSTMVPRAFPTIKRIYSRLTSAVQTAQVGGGGGGAAGGVAGTGAVCLNNCESQLLLALIQFFLNHAETVVYDSDPACSLFFGQVLAQNYHIPSVAFSTVAFCVQQREPLFNNTVILSRFFPNLLKILAWSPRSYLTEFAQLVPFLVQPRTVLEVLHSLLDLPCLSAGLEVARFVSQLGGSEADAKKVFSALPQQQKAVAAYFNPVHRPLFSFLLRPEGGKGDTISRMPMLYTLLSDLAVLPRVQICAQMTPLLVELALKTVLVQHNAQMLSQILPLMSERISQLYGIDSFQQQIRKVLANQLLSFFKVHPQLLFDHMADIIEFLSALRNISRAGEEYFSHMVWVVGEYSSPTHDSRFTIEIITKLHDVLESMAYEAISAFQASRSKPVASARLLCVLMTALAKIASRCQDLIPRVLLCLTKIVKQYAESQTDQDNRQLMVTRANELVHILKMPSVATNVMNPAVDVESRLLHVDPIASMGLVLQATSLSVH